MLETHLRAGNEKVLYSKVHRTGQRRRPLLVGIVAQRHSNSRRVGEILAMTPSSLSDPLDYHVGLLRMSVSCSSFGGSAAASHPPVNWSKK